MKLFLWYGDDVLQDYTTGMIVVLAADLETALQTIEKEEAYCMNNFPPIPTEVIELTNCSADMTPRAWITWGGG